MRCTSLNSSHSTLKRIHPIHIITQKALFPYRDDPRFWHALTRNTFRIPPQPLLQGGRWPWLYRKLLTQSRLYTWGNNDGGNLGHAAPPAFDDDSGSDNAHGTEHTPIEMIIRRRIRQSFVHHGWPRPAVVDEEVGIVADVQCG